MFEADDLTSNCRLLYLHALVINWHWFCSGVALNVICIYIDYPVFPTSNPVGQSKYAINTTLLLYCTILTFCVKVNGIVSRVDVNAFKCNTCLKSPVLAMRCTVDISVLIACVFPRLGARLGHALWWWSALWWSPL